MRLTSNHSTLVSRVYRANRIKSALQTTIVTAVALGATLAVGLTSLMV